MNDNANGTTDNALPMYVSFSTFTTFLDWIGEMDVTPSQIDRSLWSGKFAGGSGGQLMSGLRFLKLLEGEKPTDLLEELARGDVATRKTVLQRVLRDAYGTETITQLPSMTPRLLEDKLNALGTSDATRRKAFSFLVNAVRAADLPMSGGISKRARNRPTTSKGGSRGGAGKAKRGSGGGGGQQEHHNDPPPPKMDSAYAGIDWLVQQLPPQREWAQAERGRWLAALTSAVDWVVTVVDDDQEADSGATAP